MPIKILTLSILAVAAAVTPSSAVAQSCVEDTSTVIITAQRDRETPPSISFVVRNGTASPIFNIVIGEGNVPFLRIYSENVPQSIGTPEGWTGERVFKEEGEHMYYLWSAKDPARRIRPGNTLSGFSIQLPVPVTRAKPLLDRQGRPAVQADLRKVPFRVHTLDGKCYAGVVTAAIVP